MQMNPGLIVRRTFMSGSAQLSSARLKAALFCALVMIASSAISRADLADDLSQVRADRAPKTSAPPGRLVPPDDAPVEELLDFWATSDEPRNMVILGGGGGGGAASVWANGPSE